ncbi:hypothetical protein FPV67DRAFT_1484715 [Lyophyllum atratum]|nr:hypothetical protein FPV67DRAFT_1484715 [Lyophyllum atratum]
MAVDILILGAGWTSTFLIPLCAARNLTCASTSRTGRPSTVKFEFDPDSEDIEAYKALPDAHTVLITFPIQTQGASERLVRLYRWSRGEGGEGGEGREFETGFIQLGTTGIWDGARNAKTKTASTSTTAPQPAASALSTPTPTPHKWYDRHTPFAPTPRASAEIELLALSAPQTPTTVLNLAGLWGGERSPRNWVGRVAGSKEALRDKGSLHLLHGHDLARAVLAVHADFGRAAGQRWILTDGRVYDWWDLAGAWGVPRVPVSVSVPAGCVTKPTPESESGSEAHLSGKTAEGAGDKEQEEEQDSGKEKEATPSPSHEDQSPPQKSEPEDEEHPSPHAQWVRELMHEHGVRALPRDVGLLGRALDSRDFWEEFGMSPVRGRVG